MFFLAQRRGAVTYNGIGKASQHARFRVFGTGRENDEDFRDGAPAVFVLNHGKHENQNR